jgi:CRP-like cAMP-binding protein
MVPAPSAPDHASYLEIRWDVEKWMRLRLTGFGTQLALGPGERVVREGDPGDGLRALPERTRRVSRGVEGTDGGQTVGSLGPFRSFGEISLLVDVPRTATVTASSALRCVKLTRDQLTQVEDREPKLALRLYRLVAESLARIVVTGP